MAWPKFEIAIPFTPITISDEGIDIDTGIGTATLSGSGLTGPLGLDMSPSEVASEVVSQTPEVVDVWRSELTDKAVNAAESTQQAITGAGASAVDTVSGAGSSVVSTGSDWVGDVQSSLREGITPYAEAYVDWYEEGTPLERLYDAGTGIGSGIGQETQDIITGGIEATAVPITAAGESIIQPVAAEAGDVLEDLALPLAIIGGALLLTR